MDEVAALLARMRELESEVHVAGPASADAVRALEAAFGRPMPPSYRAFLERFGYVNIVGTTLSGILPDFEDARGAVWADTRRARGWCQLPGHYLVVEPDEDGFVCLDFSRTDAGGEHPVVYHMPFRETPFHELAPDYKAWLTDSLRHMVEAWDDGD